MLFVTMGDANFRAKDIGFRAQKKLLSRMANKSIAKVFIDDTTGNLLDNLYRLGRNQSGNKKEAEKVVKNIIKVAALPFLGNTLACYSTLRVVSLPIVSEEGVRLLSEILNKFKEIVIKIGILYRNDQFNQEEISTAEKFKQKFHSTAMAIVSFYEVEFSYDRNFLLQALNECRALLKNLVVRHLTEKSINRIENIFNFFANPTFLDDVFSRDSNHKDILARIVADMHKLLEDGSL